MSGSSVCSSPTSTRIRIDRISFDGAIGMVSFAPLVSRTGKKGISGQAKLDLVVSSNNVLRTLHRINSRRPRKTRFVQIAAVVRNLMRGPPVDHPAPFLSEKGMPVGIVRCLCWRITFPHWPINWSRITPGPGEFRGSPVRHFARQEEFGTKDGSRQSQPRLQVLVPMCRWATGVSVQVDRVARVVLPHSFTSSAFAPVLVG